MLIISILIRGVEWIHRKLINIVDGIKILITVSYCKLTYIVSI